jgi:hypothetical protein
MLFSSAFFFANVALPMTSLGTKILGSSPRHLLKFLREKYVGLSTSRRRCFPLLAYTFIINTSMKEAVPTISSGGNIKQN